MKYKRYLILVVITCIFSAASSSDQAHRLQPEYASLNKQCPQQKQSSKKENNAQLIELQPDSDKWYHIYAKEYSNEDYEVKIVDRSLETRVADIIYTHNRLSFYNRHLYKFDNDDQVIRKEYHSYISGPDVDQERCKKHLMQMEALLDELEQINRYQRDNGSEYEQNNSSVFKLNEKHVLLARVLDSFGRYESGVMIGRDELIGSWQQCLETKLKLGPESDEQVVGMRYCKASLGLTADLDPRIRADHLRVYIRVAICLPNSCHSDSLEDNKRLIQRLIDSQFSMPESIYVNKHRQIEDLFCTNDNNTTIELPLSGRLFVAVAIIWAILLIVATYYAQTLTSSQRALFRLLGRCFDVKQSFSDFIGQGKNSAKDDTSNRKLVNLNGLNLIKVIGMALIIVGHTFGAATNFAPNIIALFALPEKEHLLTSLFSINFVVDAFFVMSGLLFSYITLKKFKTEIESSRTLARLSKISAKLFVGRYMRLVPLYFVVFWFKKSVLLYLGSGPMWDPGYNHRTPYGACRLQSWLTPWTPLAAYGSLVVQCLPQSWSVGAEIFFILITTSAMIVLVKSPKLSIIVLGVIGSAGCLLMYNDFFNINPVDLRSLNSMDINFGYLLMAKYSQMYTNPSYRLLSVFSGLISGYFLYCYERDSRTWPIWFTKYATKIAIVAFILIIGSHFMIPTILQYDLHKSLYGLYIHSLVTSRILWALASCAVLLRLVTDCQDILAARLLSGKFGTAMSRINLALLLLQGDVIIFKISFEKNHFVDYTSWKSLDTALLIYIYTIVLAIFVHVLVESPINRLMQTILQNGMSKDVVVKEKGS